ncbi:MAG: Asp-tRNA(Asn)/Glu-tRNA(Gln) amidotransferase subunit GatA [Planctomycetota bacterium]
MSILDLSAFDLLARMSAGDVKSVDAVEAVLDRIRAVEGDVHGYLTLFADSALAQARDVDRRRAAGLSVGALAGLPIAMKDNLCTRDGTTTCASRILQNFAAPYDAHVVELLKGEDAIILGKTNMDEFAMGSSTENSAFGPTRNPWDLSRAPGGSSGGSAAVVASGEAFAAIGSDTGGSIRQPASFCGVVGLKPTYGRVSRYGLVAFASSLDQIGPITKDVRDAALLLSVLARHDPRDSTCVPVEVPDYVGALARGARGVRIAVAKEFFGEGLDPQVESAVRAALDLLARLGATVVEKSLPHSPYAVATYYIVATAEASSNLARYDGMHFGYRSPLESDLVSTYSDTRRDGFGDEVKRRIMLGTYALSAGYYDAYYLKALRVRKLIRRDFDAVFEDCDCVVGPTSPTPAFSIGEKVDDPLAMYLSDIYTISCNLAGIPGISVPCGLSSDGLPIGLQILGRPFEEDRLLALARAYEDATPDAPWRRPPPLSRGGN